MNTADYAQATLQLRARMEQALPSDRAALQADLKQLVQDMMESGMAVPCDLRNMDEILTEELVEAQFDNMPV